MHVLLLVLGNIILTVSGKRILKGEVVPATSEKFAYHVQLAVYKAISILPLSPPRDVLCGGTLLNTRSVLHGVITSRQDKF